MTSGPYAWQVRPHWTRAFVRDCATERGDIDVTCHFPYGAGHPRTREATKDRLASVVIDRSGIDAPPRPFLFVEGAPKSQGVSFDEFADCMANRFE